MFATALNLRRVAACAVLALAASGVVGCSDDAPGRPNTVADFDKHPCSLLTEEDLSVAIRPPFNGLLNVEPVHAKDPEEVTAGDTRACVYTFKPGSQSADAKIIDLTVTLGRQRSGSQPYAICVAGAGNRAPGYSIEKVGDQACMNPQSDLWMKIADNYYHVVLVPQPGFPDPVEQHLALSPMILAVARAAAAHLPRT